ncbi:MAG: hypothetical protein IAF38_10405 [Bacteroidia bacterium]|nr:hypothetical protein [Bacteroidia bacterium]
MADSILTTLFYFEKTDSFLFYREIPNSDYINPLKTEAVACTGVMRIKGKTHFLIVPGVPDRKETKIKIDPEAGSLAKNGEFVRISGILTLTKDGFVLRNVLQCYLYVVVRNYGEFLQNKHKQVILAGHYGRLKIKRKNLLRFFRLYVCKIIFVFM